MNTPDFNAAVAFVAANARVLDRRRFQRLFEDGPVAPVRDAVAAYRNDDGGFGRAREIFGRVGPLIIERNLVALDPEAPGEVHGVLDFAPEPDSLARSLFDDVTVKAHLDHLAQAQLEDGGWTFNWPSWSPAAERDWRGFLTVDALRVLRTNGRL